MTENERERLKILRNKIRRLHGRGAAPAAIAERCGVKPSAVFSALMRPDMTKPERAALRRDLWVARRDQGMTVPMIARLSGVNERTVRKALAKAAELAAEEEPPELQDDEDSDEKW